MEKECINAGNETEELCRGRDITKASCRTIQSGEINDNPYMEGLREIRDFMREPSAIC